MSGFRLNVSLVKHFLDRLAVRSSLLAGTLLLIFALLFASYNTVSSQRSLHEELERHAAYLSRFGAGLVDEDLKDLRLKDLQVLMRDFASRSDFIYAHLLDRYRRIVSDGLQVTVPFSAVSRDDLFDKAVASRALETLDDGAIFHVAQPVILDNELIGVLRFGISLDDLHREGQQLALRNLAIAALFLAIALPLIGYVTHHAMGPIRKLTESSRRIADGELDAHIETQGTGEIAELGRSMSRMVRNLFENAAEIRALTFIDTLTGLPNRAQLELRLQASIADIMEASDRVALLLVDIDRFQRVNDALGPDRGDQLLRMVADRLENVIEDWRETEAKLDGSVFETVVARLSADEYGVMLAGALSEPDITAALRRIMRGFDESFQLDEHIIDLNASIGVAISPTDGRDFSTLVQNAGVALQACKRAGRGMHRFFAPELDERAFRRLVLESDLRQALDRGELDVYFQPQVSAADGGAIGAEALVRWHHPTRGLVSPGEFIPLAEECGLIVDIGRFVLRQVCAQGARWAMRGLTPRLSVNVSSEQFHRADFAMQVLEAVAETGMDPSLLELEVTESVAMNDPASVAAKMSPLRDVGIRFAIDDFGTGYSSLSVLTRLPFDVLKIDRSFIRDIDKGDGERRVLVATMLGMARALGLEVVAEGVETIEEHAVLREIGCPIIQGFLFAKPMTQDAFAPWYIAHRRRDARLLQGRLREAMAFLPQMAAG